ncbi:hypothetical protein LLE49_24765 [Alicyclobacillus tolerans]|uniref:hypothetical protein n=1 Tax=Alicyclobacillus tolerans TaxID=90970 RepID=UPI001F1DAEBB|nr:hypothetical protein [Alicyclobacillus tolerans]MCF8567940.1 hypothetical protein [Alicyclobacillus tolerans]
MPERFTKREQKEMVDYLKTTKIWAELKEAIDGHDEKKTEELVHKLLFTMSQIQDQYEKMTVDVKKDLIKEVKLFCAKNHYTMKTFVNVALETLLQLGMPEEE